MPAILLRTCESCLGKSPEFIDVCVDVAVGMIGSRMAKQSICSACKTQSTFIVQGVADLPPQMVQDIMMEAWRLAEAERRAPVRAFMSTSLRAESDWVG